MRYMCYLPTETYCLKEKLSKEDYNNTLDRLFRLPRPSLYEMAGDALIMLILGLDQEI